MDRVKELYELAVAVMNEEPIDAIIEDYINQDGTRVYSHLTFFSEHYFTGIANFLTEDTIFLHNLSRRIESMYISKRDYDFKQATEKSRLTLNFNYDSNNEMSGNFTASKENCDHLWTICQKYFFSLI